MVYKNKRSTIVFDNNTSPPLSEFEYEDNLDMDSYLRQWEDQGDGSYRGIGKTKKELPPGLYKVMISNQGTFFSKQGTSTHELIRFEDSSVDSVMSEIDKFWSSRDKYRKFDVQYKRGILMHGPPGSGKSSIIKMLINDVISRGGIAIDFEDSASFREGISIIRKIHLSKPIVVIMEDIESLMKHNSPSAILNVLDGSTNFLDNIIFVATSNYPEQLEQRIKDRPSRFDRVIEVGLPSAKMRELYLKHLFKNAKQSIKPVNKWVRESEGLTFPHLQELFLSVKLYDQLYDVALERVRGMSKSLSSDAHRKKFGFSDMIEDYEDEDR
jgi:tRNA uridine 5-carbamoylmethylation protein Kti12